jgi:hypothetical protein
VRRQRRSPALVAEVLSPSDSRVKSTSSKRHRQEELTGHQIAFLVLLLVSTRLGSENAHASPFATQPYPASDGSLTSCFLTCLPFQPMYPAGFIPGPFVPGVPGVPLTGVPAVPGVPGMPMAPGIAPAAVVGVPPLVKQPSALALLPPNNSTSSLSLLCLSSNSLGACTSSDPPSTPMCQQMGLKTADLVCAVCVLDRFLWL